MLNRYVAIKEFYPSGIVNRVPGTNNVMLYAAKREKEYYAQKQRFWDEAVNTKSFNQDNSKRNHNIVDVLDYFEENDTAYFVTEYLLINISRRRVASYRCRRQQILYLR